jgi:hypothetical protein
MVSHCFSLWRQLPRFNDGTTFSFCLCAITSGIFSERKYNIIMTSKSRSVQISRLRLGSQASLEDHLAVFVAAWEQEKTLTQIPSDWKGQNPAFAGVVYMRTLWELLRLWHSESPVDIEPGNGGAYWCEQHKEIFQIIQYGMLKRVRSLWLQRGQDGRPEFAANDLIRPEDDFEKTAKTTAYIRFGDFLTGEPERMRFCDRCGKPFLKRAQQRKFCSRGCAHRAGSESSRLQKRSVNERKRLKNAAAHLGRWLSRRSHRKTSIWWKELQENTGMVNGFQTKGGRRNRRLGEYILAAGTQPGSPEREKLLTMLCVRQNQATERKKVQRDLDEFLDSVQKAQNMAKG